MVTWKLVHDFESNFPRINQDITCQHVNGEYKFQINIKCSKDKCILIFLFRNGYFAVAEIYFEILKTTGKLVQPAYTMHTQV